MTAIEQTEAWILDRRCAMHCLKCDGALKEKFDTAESETRNFLVDTLCGCKVDDFAAHPPLLWLVALLDRAGYEQFIAGIARFAPYSRDVAWQIIHLSQDNKGSWAFAMDPSRKVSFQPRFHLHPAVAPLLLAATVRQETETEDVLRLFDYFEPVATDYPVLKKALPAWHEQLARRAEAKMASEALARADWLRRQEEERIRKLEFKAIEARGPLAMISAILGATSLDGGNCSDRWARISERDLRLIPQDLLLQVVAKISCHPSARIWSGLRSRIEHLEKSRAHAVDRSVSLAKLQDRSLNERLQCACATRWSLTYFPEEWAEEAIRCASRIPLPLRTAMLSKLGRLRRRSRWRDVRLLLLSQTS